MWLLTLLASGWGFENVLMWIVVLFLFSLLSILFTPQLLTLQARMGIRDAAKTLERLKEWADESRRISLNVLSKYGRPKRDFERDFDSFLEFFTIEPVSDDPAGVLQRLDHLLDVRKKRFEGMISTLAPKADPETGEEKETKRCVGFLAVPVFRFEDTEGAPLPGYEPPPLPPLGQAVQTWGIRLEYGPSTRGEYGYLTAEGGRETIHLSSREPATLWHELGHAAHRRLLAAEGKALRGGQVPEQEIVAELVAATIARMQGEDPGKVAWCIRYMEAYAGSRARLVGEIARLADVAERCVRLIVEAAAQAAAA